MSGALSLSVTTPVRAVLQVAGIVSFRGEDDSGDFGILPGHRDFLTVVAAGVLRWRGADGPWRFCAVRGGILSVAGGHAITVACREAIEGADLAKLRARVAELRRARQDAERRARSVSAKLHARAIRTLVLGLDGGGVRLGLDGEEWT